MKMKNTKWLKVFVGSFIGLLAVASIVFMCLFNFKDIAPSELEILSEYGHITFTTSQESNGLGYTFKFKTDGAEYYIQSEQNMLEYNNEVINQGVSVGKKYKVSVAVNNITEGGRSFYSKEVEWNAVAYLDAPEISKKDDSIIWKKVDNAEYYEICYNNNGELLRVRTTDLSYPLQNLKGGISDIVVFAGTSNENYLTSISSNKLTNVVIVHEILPVYAISFTENNGRLLINIQEKFDSFTLYLDNISYEMTNFDYISPTTISCNIDYIYNGQKRIGVRPSSSDSYNKCTSKPLYIDVN